MEEPVTTRSAPAVNPYLVPLSIVVAGMCIAAALYFSNTGASMGNANPTPSPEVVPAANIAEVIDPVTDEDHVRGNASAKVTIIEYSDFQCPFCSTLHPTLKRVMEENADDVRWVYRHFPLESIHPEARPAAIASECVASLGGDAAFWNYADKLFVNQGTLGSATFASLAAEVGVDAGAFANCLTSGEFESKIDAHMTDAVEVGGTGTPHTIVLVGDKAYPIKGALPYASVKAVVDQALAE